MRLLRCTCGGVALLVLSVVALPPVARSVEEKYTIDIYKKEAQKIAIAVVGFPHVRFGIKAEDLGTHASGILTDDLKNSGIFDVIEPAFLPFEAARLALGRRKGSCQP